MPHTDLILLHAPSVYDFREKSCMYGPISDVIPSGPIFEMYPIGFLTILGYLQRHGYSVRIVNVALKMLNSRRFDAEKLIRSLNPALFGIDLHWLAHAQGSLELAAIVKKYHPNTPVVFGGLSSSYYHRELMGYPQVDYVLRGDSTEEPLRRLLTAVHERRAPEGTPNLTWRDSSGAVRVNPQSHSPESLDHLPFDYASMVRSTFRHRDLLGHIPFRGWLSYPIVAVMPWRGCGHNCVLCGGSAHSYERLCGRSRPAYRSPERIADDIARASRCIRGPVFILGDIRQAGDDYAIRLLRSLKAQRIRTHVALELFRPAPREFFERVADALPRFYLEISPESHDEEIRRSFGRTYGNEELERTIHNALDVGCRRVDLFFMTGLPKQTPESVAETVDYCKHLLHTYTGRFGGKVVPFISPLAPFLDPGSKAFKEPEKHGYRLFCRTLEEHRQALLQPSWKYMLSYETMWMNRDQLVEATYEAAAGLNALKREYGVISTAQAQKIDSRIAGARRVVKEVDAAMLIADPQRREASLQAMRSRFAQVSSSTLCRKSELNWPLRPIRFNPVAVLRALWEGERDSGLNSDATPPRGASLGGSDTAGT